MSPEQLAADQWPLDHSHPMQKAIIYTVFTKNQTGVTQIISKQATNSVLRL